MYTPDDQTPGPGYLPITQMRHFFCLSEFPFEEHHVIIRHRKPGMLTKTQITSLPVVQQMRLFQDWRSTTHHVNILYEFAETVTLSIPRYSMTRSGTNILRQ